MADEIIDFVSTLAHNTIEMNRLFSFPRLVCLILTVLMQISSIGFFLQAPAPIHLQITNIFNQFFLLFLFYYQTYRADLLKNKFNLIHMLLVDKSIDTVENFYSQIQKSNQAVTLFDAIRIYELEVYRDSFRTFCFNLIPFNLREFGHIFAFLLNYVVLFIQTSVF